MNNSWILMEIPTWEKVLIRDESNISDAIKNLNDSGLQICCVINKANEFIGTITDGDIRRGLARGLNLESKISFIVNSNAYSALKKYDQRETLKRMQELKIKSVPVLEQGKVIALLSRNEFENKTEIPNLLVILAGGMGTRLRPLTDYTPKPMIEIYGKPMLEHVIMQGISSGISNYILSVNHLADQIIDYFGSGEKLGVRIEYIREPKPLGTAGSLSLISKEISSDIIVTNCDVITSLDYSKMLDFHKENKASITMAIREHYNQIPFGVVNVSKNRVIEFVEKPYLKHFVNAGVYILKPEILSLLNELEYCDMPMLLEKSTSENGAPWAFPIFEDWTDVGRMSDLETLKAKI